MDHDFVNRLQAQLAALQGWMRRDHEDLAAALIDIATVTATTLEADGVGVWLFEKDGVLVRKAQASTTLDYKNRGDARQRTQHPLYFKALETESHILRRDVEKAPELVELLDSYYRPAGISSVFDMPVRKSGKLIGVMCVDSIAPRDWDNDEMQFIASTAALVTLSVETADRRAADRRLAHQQRELRQVLDSMVEGVISVDERGHVLSSNLAAEQILGYGPGELLALTVMDFSPALAAIDFSLNLLSTIKAAGVDVNESTQEQQARRKDGKTIPIRLSIAQLPPGPDGRKHYVGSFLDISVEKIQQETLRRSQALDSLGQLSGGIAHDFNNMLGVVLGYSELIHNSATQADDSETASKAEKIIHAGRRGRDLTRRLLDFSRRSPEQAKSVDVNQLLTASAELLRKTLTPRIELILNCQADLWPVYLDPGEFEDTILNLAINVTHAVDQRGQINLTTKNRVVKKTRAKALDIDPGKYVEVSVTDDGEGMDQDTLQRAFEPFFTSRPGEGSGLGLSQVYGFIKRIGGGLSIDSTPGEGTRVELYFPRHDQAGETVSEQFGSGLRPAIKYPGQSILVVDDEPALRQLVETVLTESGYEVTVAEDGAQALELALERRFDLVLSDVIMPVMDGYQLSETLLEKFPDQAIALMTGYEQSVNRRGGYATKVALRKPFTTDELIEVVQRVFPAK